MFEVILIAVSVALNLHPVGNDAECGFAPLEPMAEIIEYTPPHATKRDALYPVLSREGWGYIDSDGNMVMEPGIREPLDFSEGLVPMRENAYKTSAWGYREASGEWHIPPRFSTAGVFSEGLAFVHEPGKSSFDSRSGYINRNGEFVFVFRGTGEAFKDGLAFLRRPGGWSLIDKSGKTVAWQKQEIRCWSLGDYSEKRIPFELEQGRYGALDVSGKVVIEPIYRWEFRFSEGLARAVVDHLNQDIGKPGLLPEGQYCIDTDGERAFGPRDLRFEEFHEGLAVGQAWREYPFKRYPGLRGYLDKNGDWAIPPEYTAAAPFAGGRALVKKKDGRIVVIDREGEIQSETELVVKSDKLTLFPFTNGLARVQIEPGDFILHLTGELIELPDLEYIGQFSEGLLGSDSWPRGEAIWFDERGEEVFSAHGQYPSEYHEGIGSFRQQFGNCPTFFIDHIGDLISDEEYHQTGSFSEGLAVASRQKWNGKFGYIDRRGEWKIAPSWDEAGEFRDGLARVSSGGRTGYIDKAGELAIDLRYEGGSDFSQGLAAVKLGGKWGYISKRGISIIDPRFDCAYEFREDRAWVRVDGKYGLINKLGNFIREPQFDYVTSFCEGTALAGKSDFWKKFTRDLVSGWSQTVPGDWELNVPPKPDATPPWAGSWTFEVLDRSGANIVDLPYPFVHRYSDGLAAVKFYRPLEADQSAYAHSRQARWGYVNLEGELILDLELLEAGEFHEGKAVVKLPRRVAYIDMDGKLVWPPTF